MLDQLSLRARLVLGVIVLAAGGLAVAGFATYASLGSFLLDRTDQALADSHRALGRDLHRVCSPGDGRPPPGTRPGDHVEIRTTDGEVLCSRQATSIGGGQRSPPVLPSTVEVSTSDDFGPPTVDFFTTPAADGGSRYRVGAAMGPGSDAVLLVATPLDDVDATLKRLLLVELLVAGIVLAGLAGLGLWVVRLGLRPLDAIEATAAGIGQGDLSRRVERAEPRTEVGPARHRAERDAGADRVGLPCPGGVGAASAAVRRRCLPRAAHPPGRRPCVRGALHPRRRPAARRPRGPCTASAGSPSA